MHLVEHHKLDTGNNKLNVIALGQPGPGGANHRYDISGFDTQENPSAPDVGGLRMSLKRHVLLFQNGAIAEVGVNGITMEVLLAILIDRLEGFQSGPFPDEFNAVALRHVRGALGVLHDRTRERIIRNVEGQQAE